MNKNEIRKEIAELIDSIKQHSDEIGTQKRIPQIELELILSKIKRLYERSIVFNYLNTVDEANEEQVIIPRPFIKDTEPAPQPELEDVVEVFSIPAPPISEHPFPSTSGTPKKDIKKLVGLNEKFQFTKELFGNDAAQYNSALDRINASDDKASLTVVLNELASERGWQPENKTADAFRRIAERIF